MNRALLEENVDCVLVFRPILLWASVDMLQGMKAMVEHSFIGFFKLKKILKRKHSYGWTEVTVNALFLLCFVFVSFKPYIVVVVFKCYCSKWLLPKCEVCFVHLKVYDYYTRMPLQKLNSVNLMLLFNYRKHIALYFML